MNGIINLNKPAGMTSHTCVARVRRILNEKKVGHPGTLDPEATGVLPILVGNATKCSDFFLEAGKSYRGTALFGFVSDTQDVWGNPEPTGKDPAFLTAEKIEELLPGFQGEILQRPPMYSALKKDGVPLYKLARRGETAELEPRRVSVYGIHLTDFRKNGDGVFADLDVSCGRGTYIRTLIYDLGEKLGCGAVMSGLVRTSYGRFLLEDAVTLEELEEASLRGEAEKMLQPVDLIFERQPRIDLEDWEFARYMQGKTVEVRPQRITVPEGGREDTENVRIYCGGILTGTCSTVPGEKEKVRLVHGRFFAT